MSKHTRFELPENLQTRPEMLFINSPACRMALTRGYALRYQWKREAEERARAMRPDDETDNG